MYFKLLFEDGTELYRDLEEIELLRVLDEDVMLDILRDETGEDVEDWSFTTRPSTFSNVVQLDISPAVILEDPPLTIDDKKVTKISLLEDSTYEHALATLSISNPNKLIYEKNIGYTVEHVPPEHYYDEYDDGGYNDE